MKKLLVSALALLLCLLTVAFASCEDEEASCEQSSSSSSSSRKQEDSSREEESSSSSNELSSSSSEQLNSSSSEFSISTNIKDCTIENNVIKFSVEKGTVSYSFINAFTIPSKFKWELHWDQACLAEYNIVSKTINLEDGLNTLYALFINKEDSDDVYLYEIKVFRKLYYDIEPADAVNLAEQLEREFTADSPNDYFSPHMLYGAFYDSGYSEEAYIYAYENCSINWKVHATKLAEQYLTYEASFGMRASWYTSEEIEMYIMEEGFPYSVRESVLDEIDWDLQIKKYVQHLSDFYNDFNRLDAKDIIDEIIADESEIDYVLENSDIDWNRHALNIAKNCPLVTDAELKEDLMNIYLFTEDEADYAIANRN